MKGGRQSWPQCDSEELGLPYITGELSTTTPVPWSSNKVLVHLATPTRFQFVDLLGTEKNCSFGRANKYCKDMCYFCVNKIA